MSATDSMLRSAHRAQAWRWRPLSSMQVFSHPDYRAFMLGAIWIGLIGVSCWWPLADYGPPGFKWNDWNLQLFGVDVDLSFYLPWTICVCLVMWLGFEWAAVPAYLATFFSTLHKGSMPTDIAMANALHNPLALGVFFLFYCNYAGDYTLRSLRSLGWFLLAALAAAMTSSLGALVSEFTGNPLGPRGYPPSFMASWLGWWPNAFLQSVLTSAPLIYFLSPAIERAKQRHWPRTGGKPFSRQELLMAACMFALTLVLIILVSDQWQAQRVEKLLGSVPEAARAKLLNLLAVQRAVGWLMALLLAGISLGGVFFTSRWVQRMRLSFDSESRAARAALMRSEANFRNFFENNPAPMFLYDRDSGYYVDVNQAAIDRYGYSRSEFLEMTIFDIRPREDADKVRAVMRDATYRSPSFRHAGEWRHVTKSGQLIDVDVRVSALTIDNRALNLVLIYDISPRKQAQAAMERRARELQALAASSLQIAGAKSVDEVLTACAERARELSGARLALVRCEPGHLRASFGSSYADWQASDMPAIWQLLIEKRYPVRLTAAEVGERRYLGVTARGEPVAVPLLAAPLTRSDSEVIGALIVADKGAEFDAEDESILLQLSQTASAGIESVQLREALEEHMRELESRVTERTAELDAFAYSVAHDLRAPLRAMHGFADALLEDYAEKLDEAGRDYLQRIVKSAKNMDTLIQDLLAYSRIGRDRVELQGIPLADLVQEVLSDLHQEIEARQAAVEAAVPPLTVLGHKATLKQVIVNLVSNALKFVAPGVRPELRIWAVARKGGVELCVRDNGIGIAPEHRERIFNVFERLHGAETYPGTGIGLSIVKKGLASMQGTIKVESDGKGSVFQASLKEYRDG